MVIKKLSSFVCTLFALRVPQVCKESSNAVTGKFCAPAKLQERPNNGHGLGEPLEGELCCVCLSRLNEGEGTRILPCMHEFHKACIGRWLDVCRKTCPVCRFSMADEEKTRRREELTDEMMIWFSSFHAAGFWCVFLFIRHSNSLSVCLFQENVAIVFHLNRKSLRIHNWR